MNPNSIIRTILAIVFSTLCFLMQGQSFDLESILDKLTSENIITEDGSAYLKSQYAEYKEVKALTILRGLTEVYGGEFLHRSNLFPLFKEMDKARANSTPLPKREKMELNLEEPMVTPDPELEGKEPELGLMTSSVMSGKGILAPGVVPEHRSVFGRNLISLSDKLVEIGLISLSFKEEYTPPIKDKLVPEFMMFMLYTFYLEELERQPAKLKKVLAMRDEWLVNGILVDSIDIDEGELSEVFDLVKYSPYGIELSKDELSMDAREGYGEIFASVSELAGVSMELKEFDFILKEDTLFSSVRISAVVVIESNDSVYRDTLSYGFAGRKHTVEEAKRTRFTTAFINILNKVLSDANVCNRLYYINAGESGYSSDKIGLMFLGKEHYFAIKKTSKTYFIFGPHPEESLNECRTERLIDEAIEIGLITRRPSQEVMDKSKSLVEAIVESCNDNFDSLYKIDGLSNEMLLSLIQENSKGTIRFSEVKSEDISVDSLAFSFVYDGVTHEQTLSKKRSYDYSLYLSLKKVLRFKDDAPQFYTVSRMMDDFGMTFLTIEQKDWIEKNGNNFYTNRFGDRN